MKLKTKKLTVNSDLVADILYHAVVAEWNREDFDIPHGDLYIGRAVFSDPFNEKTSSASRHLEHWVLCIVRLMRQLHKTEHMLYTIVLGPHEVVTVDIDYGYVEITQESPNTFRQYSAKFI